MAVYVVNIQLVQIQKLVSAFGSKIDRFTFILQTMKLLPITGVDQGVVLNQPSRKFHAQS